MCDYVFPDDIRGRLLREVKKKSKLLGAYNCSANMAARTSY
jgi:hypothetical protein